MNKTEEKYIKMTETPVSKLVSRLAIPTIISMLVTNLYNTADTYFVSKISVSASGATGIVFSLMAFLQAFGFMFGQGAGSNVSRLLGAKHYERASTFVSTSFILAAATGGVIGILGLVFPDGLMRLLGSTETMLEDAKAYGVYILIAGPAFTTSCVLNNVLRYEGIAVFSMIGITSGCVINLFLDPVLIFALGMGTSGAGLSTAISQYISLLALLIPFIRGRTVTKIAIKKFTRSISDIGNIVLTGLPSLLRHGLNSIASTILNVQASVYGDAAIAAFSIVNRFSNLLFSLAHGLGQGFQPVSAFNFGAKIYSRVRKAFRFTIICAMGILGVLCTISFINAEAIISLFRDDAAVVRIGSTALRYMCLGLVMLPLSAIGSMLFQSTGKKGRAIIVASMQSGAIFIPLLVVIPKWLGLSGLEMTQPLAYAVAGLISLPIVTGYLTTMKDSDGVTL